MAWLVHTWKILRIFQDSLYLERFVQRHATAHIHKRCKQFKTNIEKNIKIWIFDFRNDNSNRICVERKYHSRTI